MIAIALEAFTKYGVTDLVKLIEGPAAESMLSLRGEFDIIFIDADKPGYKKYLEIILDRGLLSKNGIIFTDNSIQTYANMLICQFCRVDLLLIVLAIILTLSPVAGMQMQWASSMITLRRNPALKLLFSHYSMVLG